jgi:hypothetical protein
MSRITIRRALTLAGAMLAGGALALPFATAASGPGPIGAAGATSGVTETTGTTSTTPTTGTGASTTPPPAQSPPRVGAASVERVATTSAVVAATIDAQGIATVYRIQYGATAAYGAQTGPASAGSGSGAARFTRTLPGLAPNTTYHFRVVASNAGGATLGADASFTTAKVPPTLSASVTPGTAAFGRPLTLSGTAAGPESAGVQVVVQENPFPYNRGFQDITAPQTVGAGGSFSFSLPGLFESAQLRVATAARPLAYSPPVQTLIAVRVTLHARRTRRHGYVRLYGTVTPSEPGARVAFERWQHGRYAPVSGTRIAGAAGTSSRFARVLRMHHGGRYCAFVAVAGGGPLASGRSAGVSVH